MDEPKNSGRLDGGRVRVDLEASRVCLGRCCQYPYTTHGTAIYANQLTPHTTPIDRHIIRQSHGASAGEEFHVVNHQILYTPYHGYVDGTLKRMTKSEDQTGGELRFHDYFKVCMYTDR